MEFKQEDIKNILKHIKFIAEKKYETKYGSPLPCFDYTYLNLEKIDSLEVDFVDSYNHDSDDRDTISIALYELNLPIEKLEAEIKKEEEEREKKRQEQIAKFKKDHEERIAKQEWETYQKLKSKFEK